MSVMQLAARARCALRRRAAGAAVRRPLLAIAGLVGLALLAGACSATGPGTTGGQGGGRAETLTFAYPAAPTTLDPGKADQNVGVFQQPVYDPLIRIEPDGSFSPSLATQWGYVGAGNQTFEMTIREGLTFTDGEALTAAGVKKHLEYVRDAKGSSSGFLQAATIENPTPSTVRIQLGAPYPLVPFMLSQYNVPGNVISPRAIDDPDSLGTTPVGIGKYVLDPANTVAGDRYTYTANPGYWAQDQIHYDRIVIRVITNPQSVLNALRAREVDVAIADLTIADGAESAGLTITGTQFLFEGLVLADREGTLAPPLADVRVRQALNFAVDRVAITEALHGKHGTPTTQTVPQGASGYSEAMAGYYPYDPERARQLLAEAGYPAGFELDVLSTPTAGIGNMAQAIAGELDKIGVKVNLVTKDAAAYQADLQAGKYPVLATALGAGPMAFEYAFLLAPDAPFNPFGTTDPALEQLTNRMLTAAESERAEVDRQVEEYLVTQAWVLPVSFVPLPYYSTDAVTGIELSPGNPLATVTDWRAAGSE